MTGTITDIAKAFEWHYGRPRDEQWLPEGTNYVLRELLDFNGVTDATLWAVALLLTVMEKGGTCLPLASIANLPETARIPEELRNLSVAEWTARLTGDVFGDGGDAARPLVVAHERLYFDRLYRLERDVARRLLAPLGDDALREPLKWRQEVAGVFGASSDTAGQREVAEQVFARRVSVVAGGPGTGKTHTVAQLLVALHRATGGRASVKLCAPTGKAAQRIAESLQGVIHKIDPDLATELLERISPTTIHRALGITPLAARRRHTEPLHVDFVIVDETSMVDLALFDELLRAISDHTRIILVGDPNQLQSVDVGTVMSDLVDAMGDGLPGVTLEHVFRLDSNTELTDAGRQQMLNFFDAIRHGRHDEALGLLDSGSQFLTHIAPDEHGQIPDDLPVLGPVFARAQRLRELAAAGEPATAWNGVLTSTMVLCAQHRGDLSREWWVSRVAGHLSTPLGSAPSSVGLPVLITANDRVNGVTNGDTGLIVTGPAGQPVYRPSHSLGSTENDDTAPGDLSPTAVHEWQPWWAMTIHKSQGSEFDSVVVSITPGTRLLSRELLYTAVTRAKKDVTIIGTRDDIAHAITTPAKRYSGLADILREELATL